LRALKTQHLLLPFLLVVLAAGCRKDQLFTDNPSAQLVFTEDTVYFDTVFTTVGTVTKRFTARNPASEGVRVNIDLEGGSPSPYRINVDGSSGLSFPVMWRSPAVTVSTFLLRQRLVPADPTRPSFWKTTSVSTPTATSSW
jgi:hypothetical protein